MKIPSKEPDFEVSLKNNHAGLAGAAKTLENNPTFSCLPGDGQYAVSLVLDELGSNVIRYGSGDGAEICMTLRFWVRNHEVVILFENEGPEFDPAGIPQPQIDGEIDERKVGGLGIHLLKNYLDWIDSACQDGKNQFLFKKTFNLQKDI